MDGLNIQLQRQNKNNNNHNCHNCCRNKDNGRRGAAIVCNMHTHTHTQPGYYVTVFVVSVLRRRVGELHYNAILLYLFCVYTLHTVRSNFHSRWMDDNVACTAFCCLSFSPRQNECEQSRLVRTVLLGDGTNGRGRSGSFGEAPSSLAAYVRSRRLAARSAATAAVPPPSSPQ